MKAQKTKAARIREYLKKYPAADVAKVAAKFKTAKPVVYKLRKEVQEANVVLSLRSDGGEIKKPKREKVTLTAGQFLVAKKLGIDPFEYAKEAAKHAPEPAVQEDEGETWTATSNDAGDIVATLTERGTEYGKFKDGAALMQGIKRLMADHARAHDKTFSDDQWEALEMIVHKIGRIVNGNPDKVDHWVDIAGYAKLVADRLQGVER